jgi:hypothetical protein
VILELPGWTNTAYIQNELGINPSVLNKFVKIRGVIRTNLARKIADRIRSYLKSQDQPLLQPDVTPSTKTETRSQPKPKRLVPPI